MKQRFCSWLAAKFPKATARLTTARGLFNRTPRPVLVAGALAGAALIAALAWFIGRNTGMISTIALCLWLLISSANNRKRRQEMENIKLMKTLETRVQRAFYDAIFAVTFTYPMFKSIVMPRDIYDPFDHVEQPIAYSKLIFKLKFRTAHELNNDDNQRHFIAILNEELAAVNKRSNITEFYLCVPSDQRLLVDPRTLTGELLIFRTPEEMAAYATERRAIAAQAEAPSVQVLDNGTWKPMPGDDQRLVLGHERTMLEMAGHEVEVCWDYTRHAHMLIVGGTGSGKSYAVVRLLHLIWGYMPGAQIWINDYKASKDYDHLAGEYPILYYTAVVEGVEKAHAELRYRQEHHQKMDCPFTCLVFDEYTSYLNSLEKKEAERIKGMMGEILAMGRAFNIHIICVTQRGDAKFFDSARDNFSLILGMGNLSEEQKAMLFREFRDEIEPIRKIGGGYLNVNGEKLVALQVPSMTPHDDFEAWKRTAT